MKKNNTSLRNKLLDSKFDFVKNLKWFFLASCIIIIAGIFTIIFAGFNLGMDFTGGTAINIQLGESIETDKGYNDALNKINNVMQENNLKLSSSQKEGEGAELSIIIKYQDIKGYSEEQMEEVSTSLREGINKAFEVEGFVSVGDDYDITESAERVSSTARSELIFNALVAIFVSITLILVYVAFRFEPLSGIASTLCLLHDVLITLSLVAMFRIQVNTAFIAAIITIIGYSINNSIIIFDRVRENIKKPSLSDKTNKEIVNISIKQSLLRTINTTATTLLAVLMLAIIGVSSIREFIIVIIIGIVSGIYSSIFLASPFWAVANKPRKLVKPKVDAINDSQEEIVVADTQNNE